MRTFTSLFVLALAACGGSSKSPDPVVPETTTAESTAPPPTSGAPEAPAVAPAPAFRPVVHAWSADAGGIFASSYVIETENGVVVVDGALRVSDGKAIAAKVASTKKPLLAVLVTHGHPDHYNGITEILGSATAPVVATTGVDKVIREHDAAKEKQWKGMFKDEWPAKRTFPTKTMAGGETITLGGVTFTAHDLGPGESHHDTFWTADIGGEKVAFVGDVVLHGMHAYTADGHTTAWLANIDKVKAQLGDTKQIYPGHGEPGGIEILDWQKSYLEAYRSSVAKLAKGKAKLSEPAKKQLVADMKKHTNTDKGEFLIALGADAVAAELAKK